MIVFVYLVEVSQTHFWRFIYFLTYFLDNQTRGEKNRNKVLFYIIRFQQQKKMLIL